MSPLAKRLRPFLGPLLETLERCGELRLPFPLLGLDVDNDNIRDQLNRRLRTL